MIDVITLVFSVITAVLAMLILSGLRAVKRFVDTRLSLSEAMRQHPAGRELRLLRQRDDDAF